MSSRVRGEVLALLLLRTILFLKLVFFLTSENEAVEIDLGDVEGG